MGLFGGNKSVKGTTMPKYYKKLSKKELENKLNYNLEYDNSTQDDTFKISRYSAEDTAILAMDNELSEIDKKILLFTKRKTAYEKSITEFSERVIGTIDPESFRQLIIFVAQEAIDVHNSAIRLFTKRRELAQQELFKIKVMVENMRAITKKTLSKYDDSLTQEDASKINSIKYRMATFDAAILDMDNELSEMDKKILLFTNSITSYEKSITEFSEPVIETIEIESVRQLIITYSQKAIQMYDYMIKLFSRERERLQEGSIIKDKVENIRTNTKKTLSKDYEQINDAPNLKDVEIQIQDEDLDKNSNSLHDYMHILKTRYAKGEITKEEFDRMKEDLKD